MKKLFFIAFVLCSFYASAQVKSDAEMGVYNNTNIRPNTTGAIKAQMHNNMNKYLIASKVHKDSITNVRILSDTCIEVRYKTVKDTVCFVSRDEMVQRLDDLLDVDLTEVDSGDILRFDDESNLWKNVPMPDYAPLGDSSKWTLVPPDTIKTAYNVKIDSSFVWKYNNAVFGYDPFNYGDSAIYSGMFKKDTSAYFSTVKIPGYYANEIMVESPFATANINTHYLGTLKKATIGLNVTNILNPYIQSSLLMTDSSIIIRSDSTVIDSGLYLTHPDMSDTRVGFLMAWEPTTGNTFPTSASNVGDAIDSARAASPTPYTTWVRDTTAGILSPADVYDIANTANIYSDSVKNITTLGVNANRSNNYGTFIGHDAGLSAVGNYGVYVGNRAGEKDTSTTNGGSTFIGYVAGLDSKGEYNTYVGYNSGYRVNATGVTAVGLGAGSEGKGDYGAFLGWQAGWFNDGNWNVGVGLGASEAQQGNKSVFIGQNCGYSSNNDTSIAIGFQALHSAGADNSICFGYMAGQDLETDNKFILQQRHINTTALIDGDFKTNMVNIRKLTIDTSLTNNGNYLGNKLSTLFNAVRLGYNAGYTNTASYNVYVGYESGYTNNTGTQNVLLGYRAGYSLTYSYNTLVGYLAGYRLSGGYGNTGLGTGVLNGASVHSGSLNTAIGYSALGATTGASENNTAVGANAGVALTTGDGNVFIGQSAGALETTGSNKLFIENSNSATPLIYGDFANDYVNIVSKLHIGTSLASPTVALSVAGDANFTGQITYDFKHLVAYLTAGSYTPDVVSNTPFKLAPGLTTTENDGLTFAGDTVTIITPGDYKLDMSIVFQGSNGDDFLFTVHKNGTVFTSGNLALSTTGAGNYIAGSWFYYFPGLVAGDDISFYLTNEGASTDPTFRAFKIYLEKKPE